MTGHLYCDEININTLTELRGNINIFCQTVNIFILFIVVVFCCKLKISLKQTSMLLFDALVA